MLGCGVALFASGCLLDRSGTGPNDGATPPGLDAGPAGLDAGRADAGRDAGFDAGWDAGVDSAAPIPDACVPMSETCDDFDQDCDGIIDDELTRTCTTSCGTGTDTCILGSWYCNVREPSTELCDGLDNDCDGAADFIVRPCSTACGAGTESCAAGVWSPCSVREPSPETCDGDDDDCNGLVDDGLMRSCNVTTMTCGTVTGTQSCAGGMYGPCVLPPFPAETCNGRDDDCDGTIDDAAGCPCTQRHHGGHSYLFCTAVAGWSPAVGACRALGYELVTVNDGVESTLLSDTALALANDDWWIGLNDQRAEGTWVWSFGTSSYTNWDSGEPGGPSADSADCASVENGSSSFETRGRWGDRNCNEAKPYVCESP